MPDRTFVGFGFGAIQAGLFVYEAFRSGNFRRLVVAEVVPDVVDAVRKGGGRFRVNVAQSTGIEPHEVTGVEIFNPNVEDDRRALVEAVAEASEINTALPSVKFYGSGQDGDVISVLGPGLSRKAGRKGTAPAIIYTAENHNHAAEILEQGLLGKTGAAAAGAHFQCLNTVIGKMSGVVTDAAQIREQSLATVTERSARAFLVEAFNRILITRVALSGFSRGITVFEEKTDLLPFEEAKLYGHNATHALIGYLLKIKGRTFMAEAREDASLMKLAREASVEESGAALCRKHRGLDPLFTPSGYAAYVDDLLERMLNPWLRDTVERITRDPKRKLGWDDRLVGTMRVAMRQGIRPDRYALGAAAALKSLESAEHKAPDVVLAEAWEGSNANGAERDAVMNLILDAARRLS